MVGILIYLMVGILFGFILENIWYQIEDEEELTMGYRIIAVFLWPIVILAVLVNILGNDDGFVGPGGAGR